MNKQQQKEFNGKCAKFLGYTHYKRVDQDISDIGGIYEKTDIYSKIPIEVREYKDDDLVFFTDNWYQKARPGANECLYIENPDFVNDWNQIMLVIEEIEKSVYKIIIEANYCGILEYERFTYMESFNTNTKKESVIKSLDKFFNWHDKLN